MLISGVTTGGVHYLTYWISSSTQVKLYNHVAMNTPHKYFAGGFADATGNISRDRRVRHAYAPRAPAHADAAAHVDAAHERGGPPRQHR